jgi:hypothetical protein
LAEAERERVEETGGERAPTGERPHPRLRRGPFGYRRADVDAALAARDAELAELRQDVAALWLAFAQHDRLLREGGTTPVAPATTSGAASDRPAPAPEPSPSEAVVKAASIGAQLSELDQVLGAIEEATRTLERTYADEIEPAPSAERGAADDETKDPGTRERGTASDEESRPQ